MTLDFHNKYLTSNGHKSIEGVIALWSGYRAFQKFWG
jgi:hypothetical protein